MQVLVVANWYPSAEEMISGTFIEEQVIALRDRFDVAVIAPRMRQWRTRFQRAPFLDEEVRRGVPIVRVDAVPLVPYLRHAAYEGYARAVRRAYEHMAGTWGRPDLIHAHVVRHAGIAALRLGRELGTPVILTEHSGPFGVHLQHRLDRKIVAHALSQFDAVIAVSPSLKRQMRLVSQRPVDVIGNVVDTDFFSPAEPMRAQVRKGRMRVLTAAILTQPKRIDLLILAVSELVSVHGHSVQLSIVGDGPERSNLEELARGLSLGSAVRFVGSADRATVREEMRQSDVFVLPSESETFGVVVAEAMACGTPVIATRSGGPEFVMEAGLGVLIPTGSVEALVDALLGLFESRIRLDRQLARDSIVRRFGRPAVVEALTAVYARVLAARGQAPRIPL